MEMYLFKSTLITSDNGSLHNGDSMFIEDDISRIRNRLERIETDLSYIRDHMVDVDTILTPEEKIEHERSMREYIEGKSRTLEDLERE